MRSRNGTLWSRAGNPTGIILALVYLRIAFRADCGNLLRGPAARGFGPAFTVLRLGFGTKTDGKRHHLLPSGDHFLSGAALRGSVRHIVGVNSCCFCGVEVVLDLGSLQYGNVDGIIKGLGAV